MASYAFFPTANKAQDDIWDYMPNEWGQKQAEQKKYC